MTLRTRLLITFIALGAVPLLVVGWVTNQRNLRAVEDLVARETRLVAERVAEEIGERYDARLSEVLFLAENTETLRLFGESPLPSFASDPNGPGAFLTQAWETLTNRFQWCRFVDSTSAVALAFGVEDPAVGRLVIFEPVSAPDDGAFLGTVEAALRPAAILPGNLHERGFGEGGFVALIDSVVGRILYHPQRSLLSDSVSALLPAHLESVASTPGGTESFRFSDEGQEWIASLTPIQNTSWVVLSSSPLDGFSRPFQNVARTNLFMVLTITLLASTAFLVATLRTTRSLVELTGAARRVAQGDLNPNLPPSSRDEVGTLSETFGTMLKRIRRMIRQVEESRQLAAVGEFSAQIAHELRNPLTAIRMSLQGLSRVLSGTEHARPLEIALRETERLDRVASGVLSLGRRGTGGRSEVTVVSLLTGALDSVASELEEAGVTVSLDPGPGDPVVQIDEAALRGALINLLRNSAEAMPDGGKIRATVEVVGGDTVRIHLTDDGPGIPPDLSGRMFDPFVTTKARGNGFGLPLALRAVESNGGKLRLDDSTGDPGAHFVLDVPLFNPEDEE